MPHRAFGTDPHQVSDHVLAFTRGMRDAGVVTTVKHFPGLGGVRANTDFSTGVVDGQMTATDPDLLPFASASRVETSCDGIQRYFHWSPPPGGPSRVQRRCCRSRDGRAAIAWS